MLKRLFHMFLFIVASMAIIIILISPFLLFHGYKLRNIRKIATAQSIAPQRLYIACWRNIKALYYDPKMNNQDWNRWKYRYLKHIKTDEDVAVAVNTMLASLNDEYSEFFGTKKYTLQENYITQNDEAAIPKIKIMNVRVNLNVIAGMVQSAEVVSESNYYKNLKVGDVILSINNYPIKNMEMNSAVGLLRGKNPISKIEILRNNKKIIVPVVSGAIDIIKINTKILDNNIVYIYVYSLMSLKSPKQFKQILNVYRDNVNGFIIDLRGDVGGLFLNAIYIADELIDKGELLNIKYRDGSNITINADIPSDPPNKPIVVLINKQTASASEILAGALRSNNKAILVGESTYGKNEIQQIVFMPNMTCLNLTTAKYLFCNGFNSDGGSIEPDYPVKITLKDILSGNDTQLKKAIEVINEMNNKNSQ
ncbi:PDZ domain-containing protein [bacterium]|nr:PDZ domain-containing protein [bacterium]